MRWSTRRHRGGRLHRRVSGIVPISASTPAQDLMVIGGQVRQEDTHGEEEGVVCALQLLIGFFNEARIQKVLERRELDGKGRVEVFQKVLMAFGIFLQSTNKLLSRKLAFDSYNGKGFQVWICKKLP